MLMREACAATRIRILGLCAVIVFCAAADGAHAQIDTITVEAARHREAVEKQVQSFVSHVASKPYESSLARWQTVAPICPLVAGLPREDGEYILARVSQIAAADRK